uniref:Endochitinase 2 ) n=1 Tax=Ganoderma boninense TaxID=34458 RepID=A0A5K1JR85_9APHY|nr:Endochitinase 2 (EC (Chitinase 2) [Ganoderma boninense]
METDRQYNRDIWARTISPNKNVKVFIGTPASPTAAGSGYQDPATLANELTLTRNRFPSFGGVMLWDASQAYVNNRFDLAAKNALVAAGGTGFTFPACSAPAFVSGTAYTGNSQVSYNGYIWEAKWWSQSTPSADPNGDWNPSTWSSFCALFHAEQACSQRLFWERVLVPDHNLHFYRNNNIYILRRFPYVRRVLLRCSGMEFHGRLHKWHASYLQNETPSTGGSGVWTDDGACTSSKRSSKRTSEPAQPVQNSRVFRF